ncbi:sugar kinase [Sphingomonas pseudosanguinis]|uniref:sugar kinase n=1 Tax=Sphingomonas pseudosanguinis TaxID=413712 RepID=UPI003F83CB27
MRAVIIGEGMIELSGGGAMGGTARGQGWRLSYGGDTLNTALHMARSGAEVAYATALGTDPFSDDLLRAWADDGLDVSMVLRDPSRMPGLYAIRTDASGERSFAYWRSDSAARRFFELPDAATLLPRAMAADLFYFSLISLAVLPEDGRHALLDVARQLRAAGRTVAFDGNYRPTLWRDPAEAAHWRDAAIGCATIGLPTAEDEALLSGEPDAAAVEAHWRAAGAQEMVVKMGAAGCRLTGGQVVAPVASLVPIDTSGAGDAFNAAYLLARMAGVPPVEAAAAGHRLAGWVIRRRGAVPDRDAEAPYSRPE